MPTDATDELMTALADALDALAKFETRERAYYPTTSIDAARCDLRREACRLAAAGLRGAILRAARI